MEVILLERIGRLGHMGDVVRVKDGFARNFLIPQGKALRANKENKTRFESMRAELEAKSAKAKGSAGETAAKLEGKSVAVLRQASETGQLFGSVTTRDIASLLSTDGVTVSRSQVVLNSPIKTIGQYKVPVSLHPEVEVTVTVNVARSAEEAERLARGEDITLRAEQTDEEAAAAEAEKAAEALFEPGARNDAEGNEDEASAGDASAEAAPAKKAKAKDSDAH